MSTSYTSASPLGTVAQPPTPIDQPPSLFSRAHQRELVRYQQELIAALEQRRVFTPCYYQQCGECWEGQTRFLPVFEYLRRNGEEESANVHVIALLSSQQNLPGPGRRAPTIPANQLYRTQCYECAFSEASILGLGQPEGARRAALQGRLETVTRLVRFFLDTNPHVARETLRQVAPPRSPSASPPQDPDADNTDTDWEDNVPFPLRPRNGRPVNPDSHRPSASPRVVEPPSAPTPFAEDEDFGDDGVAVYDEGPDGQLVPADQSDSDVEFIVNDVLPHQPEEPYTDEDGLNIPQLDGPSDPPGVPASELQSDPLRGLLAPQAQPSNEIRPVLSTDTAAFPVLIDD